MTIFGWDSSHWDWERGPMDVGAAVRDGIVFATHKVGEGAPGFYIVPYFDDWWRRAKGVVPLPGAYYVNHPGDQYAQADLFLSQLDSRAPGWRDGPFILQVDAEKFDYMSRAPNLTEIRAFCGRLVTRTNGRYRPIVYAPQWLYGDTLAGLGYPLWASNYGTNPTVHYRTAYPGDSSSRWGAYSGQTPALLQYGSKTTIGTQTICDANAYRGTLAQLTALVTPGDDMAYGFSVESYGDGAAWRLDALVKGLDIVAGGPTKGEPVWIVQRLRALEAKLADPVDEAALAQQLVERLQPLAPGATVEQVREILASVRLTTGA